MNEAVIEIRIDQQAAGLVPNLHDALLKTRGLGQPGLAERDGLHVSKSLMNPRPGRGNIHIHGPARCDRAQAAGLVGQVSMHSFHQILNQSIPPSTAESPP